MNALPITHTREQLRARDELNCLLCYVRCPEVNTRALLERTVEELRVFAPAELVSVVDGILDGARMQEVTR